MDIFSLLALDVSSETNNLLSEKNTAVKTCVAFQIEYKK